MSPLDRAATEAMIAGQLVAMSDDDLAIVSHALAFGAPSALADGGPAPEYDRKREYGTAVLDPRPEGVPGEQSRHQRQCEGIVRDARRNESINQDR